MKNNLDLIPSVDALINPIMTIMSKSKELKLDNLVNALIDYLQLPKDIKFLKSDSKSHYLIFNYRVRQVLMRLIKRGLISRVSFGIYKITYRGIKYIGDNDSTVKIKRSHLSNISRNGLARYLNTFNARARMKSTTVGMAAAIRKMERPNTYLSKFNTAGALKNTIGYNHELIKRELYSSLNVNKTPLSEVSKNIMPNTYLSKFNTAGALKNTIGYNHELIKRELYSSLNVNKTPLSEVSKNIMPNYNSQFKRLNFKYNSLAYRTIYKDRIRWQRYFNNLSLRYCEILKANKSNNVVKSILDKFNNELDLSKTDLKWANDSLDALSEEGWCVSTKKDIKFLILTQGISDQEKIRRKEKEYNPDKINELFKKIINQLSHDESLNNGRLKMLKDIFTILEKGPDKMYLFCGDIFAICEYIFYEKLHTLFKKPKNYLNFGQIKDLRKDLMDKLSEKSKYTLYSVKFVSVVKVMYKFWKPKSHNAFGRDTIQHGYFDPEKIKSSDFAKIVQLLYSILNLDNPNNIFS